MEYFSASRINTFLTCPQAYYYKYIVSIDQEKPSLAMVFGRAIHEGIASFYNGEDYKKPFKRVMKEESVEKVEEKIIDQGLRLLDIFVEDTPFFFPAYIEKTFLNKIQSPEGEVIETPLKFIIDLITDDGFIIDHKTTSGSGDKQLETDRIQAILYTLGYKAEFGKSPKGFIQNSLIKRVRKPRINTLLFEYSEDDEMYVFNLVKEALKQIGNEEFFTAYPVIRTFFPCKYKVLCSIHG